MSSERYLAISDYAFLSDCHSTALVSREGSIDWACLRRFDAGSVFGRILDADRGGCFSIRPADDVTEVQRRYLPSTLIVETTMRTEAGSIRCTDAFAMSSGGAGRSDAELVRLVECIDGSVELDVLIQPRFDYGRTRPWLREHGDGRFSAVGGDDALVIHASAELDVDRDDSQLTALVALDEGQSCAFSAVSQAAHLLDTAAADCLRVSARLDDTTNWWVEWSEATESAGEHAELLERSAIVLKGLTCAPTGAVIAAPTTSLPEVPGGSANWDYRYSWVRDSTLALASLAEMGHHEVAEGFRDFVMRSSAGQGSELQIMYGCYGERRLPEQELDLEGWRGSAPVRIGNGAATQTQLDVFGHLLDAAHLWHRRSSERDGAGIDDDEWRFLASVVDQAVAQRDVADSGVWEMRGPPRHFVQSKVMIWVALDRGISLVEDYDFPDGSAHRWRTVRDEVRHEIESRGVDPDRGNFVQYYGTLEVDASLLKLPLVGFVDADDKRMRSTTDVIMDELGVGPNGFLRRYRSDGDGSAEGVFLLCSFWLVEVLALQGRLDEAQQLFEALVGVANDVGLFSEEYDVDHRRLLGNFPQAFTHLGLIAAEKRLRSVRG